MGKLADLRAKREEMEWDHPDRIKIEKEINKIEQWMIDNNIGHIKKLTTWEKNTKKWKPFGYYPEEGWVHIGNFIVHQNEIDEFRKICS